MKESEKAIRSNNTATGACSSGRQKHLGAETSGTSEATAWGRQKHCTECVPLLKLSITPTHADYILPTYGAFSRFKHRLKRVSGGCLVLFPTVAKCSTNKKRSACLAQWWQICAAEHEVTGSIGDCGGPVSMAGDLKKKTLLYLVLDERDKTHAVKKFVRSHPLWCPSEPNVEFRDVKLIYLFLKFDHNSSTMTIQVYE